MNIVIGVYLDDDGSRTGCCCLSVGGSKICSRSSLESSNSANWSISAMFNERVFGLLFQFVSDLFFDNVLMQLLSKRNVWL